MHSIRIVIADDHALFRDGLRRLLEAEADLEVVGEAVNGSEAVELTRRHKPDVLLLDVSMPQSSGIESLRQLSEGKQSTHVIVLTALIERDQIVEALQLGARGIVLKESATDVLIRCIHSVIQGHYWVDGHSVPSLLQVLDEMRKREPAAARRSFNLTPREREIIQAIVHGAPNKAIAADLKITEQTVKNHLSAIFDKLGVSTRLELALLAVKHNIVEADTD